MAGFFSAYHPPLETFDELVGPEGIRPHWHKFAETLGALGRDELARRWEQARRIIYENGVAYNVHDRAGGMERPWELDPIPVLIASQEWDTLSAGLIQRARLLNAILADLYGPQVLLTEGLLPPELVLGHPGFLRRFHKVSVPHGVYLHLYATDLGRSADGRWCVLADRTQAAAGAGYALENRIVVSRMLPQIFRDAQVQRLAVYFIALRETLQKLAPQHRDNPRIVLLTPGARSETYFEDAYLARYLGYTLVEGEDLTVRDYTVYMKTLGGLLPVDVVLRRLYDEDCDPLELKSDSLFGVPGLAQAVRTGNVAVANSLGSGLAETPAFSAFLPSLCRRLLHEELKIPSVSTWWCGQEHALQYVLNHLSELMIRPTFPGSSFSPVYGGELSSNALAALAAQIQAQPGQFVAQEHRARSTAPVWTGTEGGSVRPMHLAVRTYMVASGGTYTAMCGGLARMSTSNSPTNGTKLVAEGSKDLWVLSAGPVTPVTLLKPAGQSPEIRRTGSELPSRVADNLFWLGRHVERAEGAARLLRAILTRLTSELGYSNVDEMPALLRCLADQGQIEPGFVVEGIREQLPSLEYELPSAIFDEGQPGSLRSTLNSLHRTASIVRDRISVDSWRILRQIDQDFVRPKLRPHVEPSDALAMINELLIDLSAFSGLGVESMTRTQGWRFLDMGRRIERALHTISLLRSSLVVVSPYESQLLEALLEVADSSMTYRSRYLSNLHVAPVIDLLVTDETNPRAISFQVVALADHVEQLPRDRGNPFRTPEQRIVMSALTSLRLAEVETLASFDRGSSRGHLERLLVRLGTQLPELSNVLTKTYLIHAGLTRQLPRSGE